MLSRALRPSQQEVGLAKQLREQLSVLMIELNSGPTLRQQLSSSFMLAHLLRDDIGARTADGETPLQLSLRHNQHGAATSAEGAVMQGPIRMKKKAVTKEPLNQREDGARGRTVQLLEARQRRGEALAHERVLLCAEARLVARGAQRVPTHVQKRHRGRQVAYMPPAPNTTLGHARARAIP